MHGARLAGVALALVSAGCEEAPPDFMDRYYELYADTLRTFCEQTGAPEEHLEKCSSNWISLGRIGDDGFPGVAPHCAKRFCRQPEYVDTARSFVECDTPLMERMRECYDGGDNLGSLCTDEVFPDRLACYEAGGETIRRLDEEIYYCAQED